MGRYVLAIDQGTTSSRALLFAEDYRVAALAQRGVPAALSGFRLGRARPGGHLAYDARDRARRRSPRPAASAADVAAIGITNQRETTHRLGPRDRPADPSRHRLAGPADRGCLRRSCSAAGAEEPCHREDRAAARPVFLGDQDRLDPRSRRGRARASRARRARLRHGRQLPAVAADRRPRARDRRDQRVAHAACSTSTPATGTTTCCALSACRARMLPEVRDNAAEFGDDRAGAVRRAHPHPRHGRRPAGGDHRPGLLHARHDEVDVRHRLLCRAQHGQRRRSPRAIGCSRPSPTSSTASAPTRSKARSSSPAPPCSGCATASSVIADARAEAGRMARRPIPSRTSCSCRHSSGSARRIGTPTAVARSSG